MLDMGTINRAKVMTSKSVQVHVLGLEQELVPIKYKSRYNSDFNGNMCESFISIFFHRFVPNGLRSGSVSLFELFIKKAHAVISNLFKDSFKRQLGIYD